VAHRAAASRARNVKAKEEEAAAATTHANVTPDQDEKG
jgi:hypothetical protein